MEIKLKKASPYHWADLVASSTPAPPNAPASLPTPAAMAAIPAAPVAPGGGGGGNGGDKAKAPRPYASHKDWEAVEREIAKELEGEKVGRGAWCLYVCASAHQSGGSKWPTDPFSLPSCITPHPHPPFTKT